MDLSCLPPLFEMDDFLSCSQNVNNEYCNVQAKLNVSSSNENVAEIIKNFEHNKWTLDRNIIYRTLCIPKDEIQDESRLYAYSTQLINKKIQNFNMSAEVDRATCINLKTEMNIYDQITLAIVILYVSLLLFATYAEKKFKSQNGITRIISNLSLVQAWTKKTKIPDNVDYHNLLGMQGVRFFSLTTMVLGHATVTFHFTSILNVQEYEEIFNLAFTRILSMLFIFMVLNFFLMSSWLLTLQVNNIYEKHGEFSLKHLGILILNRYFRLLVTIVVVMALLPRTWIMKQVGPANFVPAALNDNACTQNWIHSVLFTSNFYGIFDVCNSVTWYVSADFQLFVINIFIIYIKYKFKLKEIKFYTILLFVSCLLHGIMLYIFEADVIFKPTTRNLEIRHLRNSKLFVVSYMSTLSILSSSLIGVIIGHLYSKKKTTKINKTKILNILWALTFFGIPSLVLYVGSIETTKIQAAIVGSFIKPLYTLGIALGIWGMSHNIGGPIKKIFENKILVLLSNFCYCIYLTHFIVIILVNRYMVSLVYVNIWRLVQDFIIIMIFSLVLGILVTLGVEEPGFMVQKKYLPQISSKWAPKIKQ